MSGTSEIGSYAMISQTIPSYLYVQYADDDTLQAFISAYNGMAQEYVSWFNQVGLPVWTGGLISGALLDWIGQGLYGISRPVFTTSTVSVAGPIATYPIATVPIAARVVTQSGTSTIANDDIYKRVMTWNLYAGDGKQFTTRWLKRRIARFLHGLNGTDPGISTTNDVSVAQTAGAFTITVPNNQVGQFLQQAFANGVLSLPFQYTYTVNFFNNLTDTNGAVLLDTTGQPLSDAQV